MALDLLERLVTASLVVAHEQSGRMRYGLLDTVRQYAAEQLESSRDAARTVSDDNYPWTWSGGR